MFEIKQYSPDDAEKWNEFIAISKQGTFLFQRNYMDYHADRFHDCSFIIMEKGHIYALFPANRKDNTLYSHQGLTYGGLITSEKATAEKVCAIFQQLNILLKNMGIERVIYKAIPWIYHHIPAEEDLYALTNICHAQLIGRDISSTIILNRPTIPFNKDRRHGVSKARRNNIIAKESDNLTEFWQILTDNLVNKYNVKPVHSLAEIELLKAKFPEKIRLFMAYKEEEPVGGTILYITPQVIHSQYISASPIGKQCGAIDCIYNHILNEVYTDKPYYFDFGKSTENMGKFLNTSLIFQKEGFGGRGVCYDTYEWKL